MSPARKAAFEILMRVAESDAHSDDLLHSSHIAKLSPEDRNLTTALVMGVLRWQIALDAQIAKLLARPGQQLAEAAAIALRLGVFQLQYLDRIPAHAAINESVELCRSAGQAHAAGMANAILRKLANGPRTAAGSSGEAKRRTPIFESPAAFAERLGHPAWLAERWSFNFGRDAALAICEYDQREPFAGSLFADTAHEQLETDVWPPATPIQIDDGSRLVAELAAAALPDRSDRPLRVWDCCAAPGGKILVMADRLPNAQILATDVSSKRLSRLKERAAASAVANRIHCEVLDAARSDGSERRAFDLILCDAPCSGTGTLARNPEIRHRLRPDDLIRQAVRQQAILQSALGGLAAGGRLLYSTCSLEPEENGSVVESVLAKLPDIRRISLDPALAAVAQLRMNAGMADKLRATGLHNGCLRTLPGVHPCDGFFAALLERKS